MEGCSHVVSLTLVNNHNNGHCLYWEWIGMRHGNMCSLFYVNIHTNHVFQHLNVWVHRIFILMESIGTCNDFFLLFSRVYTLCLYLADDDVHCMFLIKMVDAVQQDTVIRLHGFKQVNFKSATAWHFALCEYTLHCRRIRMNESERLRVREVEKKGINIHYVYWSNRLHPTLA